MIKTEGRWEKFENVRIHYVGMSYNKIYEFINIINENEWKGWMWSIKLVDIEAIKRI